MAALNHAKIIQALEKLLQKPVPGDTGFIYDFLLAYGASKTTINRLKLEAEGTDGKAGKRKTAGRNIAVRAGDVALRSEIYYHPVLQGMDLAAELESLKQLPVVESGRIRFLMVSDGINLAAWDKKVDDVLFCALDELLENYTFFLPLTGQYEKPLAYTAHPADLKACEKMGRLYEILKGLDANRDLPEHAFNIFLMRLIFCFFADDTGLFPTPDQMTKAVTAQTQADGSDVDDFFSRLFTVLDLPKDSDGRKTFDASMQSFPYVDGNLFREALPVPKFNAKARRMLIECGQQVWSEISPVIFGAMFQTVMDPVERREMGAHFTSEINIHKVIDPLFVDDLKAELDAIIDLKDRNTRIQRLKAYWDKIASLGFLDPACGSGNFLVVAYRELRLLEMKIIQQLMDDGVMQGDWLDIDQLTRVSINQFYGIEILELPADIARVSLCLMEHLMNVEMGKQFGQHIPTLPLKNAARIVCANALTTDWKTVVKPKNLNFIFGNPPFVGSRLMSEEQKNEIREIFSENTKAGQLDYVSAWYALSSMLMQEKSDISAAFVSTNSVCQGEHVGVLWGDLFDRGCIINFAHQTFRWNNEASNKAAVYCVIIGFSMIAHQKKRLYRYATVNSAPEMHVVGNINAYLSDGSDVIVRSASQAMSARLPINFGNMPRDGGNLIIEADEYEEFIKSEPDAIPYVKRLVGSKELLRGLDRWCLWLKGAPETILTLPRVAERLAKVKEKRLASDAKATREFAKIPHLFCQITQPEGVPAIVIPRHSSENREYIPMGFVDKYTIIGDSAFLLANATLYDFGILTSRMHMVWMRTVCGRLKSDYRYSRDLCYNTFYWPDVTDRQKAQITDLAQQVLDARDMYDDMTLADLYDPDKMPAELREAHSALDLAVDRLYRSRPFDSDEQRLRLLLKRYQQLIGGDAQQIDLDED